MELKIRHISNNYNNRSMSSRINGVVIHAAGEYINGLSAWEFFNSPGKGSYHYVVYPSGGGIVEEWVPPDRRAWHAGLSEWKGEGGLNDNFIGVCFLVPGNHNITTLIAAMKQSGCYTDIQYAAGGNLLGLLSVEYGIRTDRILGHNHVARIDVRVDPKHDPGIGFDWHRLYKEIRLKRIRSLGTI